MAYTVTFWGTRGSIPTPGAHTARYGGNTPCVAVEGPGGQLVILDAGTGIRALGLQLVERQNGAVNAEILLSHAHWDHIQGLPHFKPFFSPGNAVRIWGSRQGTTSLEAILRQQMDPAVFPIPLDALSAKLTVQQVDPGEFTVGAFRVRAMRLRHPGTTLGYRLTPAAAAGREHGLCDGQRAGTGGPLRHAGDVAQGSRGVPGERGAPDPRRDVYAAGAGAAPWMGPFHLGGSGDARGGGRRAAARAIPSRAGARRRGGRWVAHRGPPRGQGAGYAGGGVGGAGRDDPDSLIRGACYGFAFDRFALHSDPAVACRGRGGCSGTRAGHPSRDCRISIRQRRLLRAGQGQLRRPAEGDRGPDDLRSGRQCGSPGGRAGGIAEADR